MKFNNVPVQREENINIAKLFSKFYSYWKYYFIIGFICLTFAIVFILVTPSQYDFKSSLQIIGEKEGMTSELKMLKSTGLGSIVSGTGAGVNADDEVLIIQSRAILGEMIRKLGLQVDIKQKDGLKMISVYKDAPLSIEFPTEFLDTLSSPISMKISISQQKIKIKMESALFEEKNIENLSLPYTIKSPVGNIKINNTNLYSSIDKEIEITVYPFAYAYELYTKALSVTQVDATSDIIEFNLKDNSKARGLEILNTTMKLYNDYSKSVKVMESNVNASFVSEKLGAVTSELDSIENKIELYKKQNNIPDLAAYGSVVYMGSEESQRKILEMQTQLKLMDYVLNYVKNPNNQYAIAPNISYGGEAITSAYNSLMFERFRLLRSTEPSNPAIVLLNDQLKEQRRVLIESINSAIKALNITIAETNKKNLSLNSQLSELPSKEKEFIELKRLQKVKETLYLFLLQKLNEKEVSNSPNEMASRVVDYAYCSYRPVSPKKIIVLPVAFVISIMLSIIVIAIKLWLIKKTASKDDLYDNMSIPVWGEFSDYESFKMLRNFIYSKEKDNNIFMITSNIKGEGKTFFASNLAKSLSMTDKKIALINMDFTKQSNDFLKSGKNEISINKYIIDNQDISKLLSKESPNLSVIQSEQEDEDYSPLVYCKKMEELMNYLRANYDYVIIDTASLSVSTSAYDISHLADYTFFIFREEFTPKNRLENINKLIKSNLLPNICVVINSNIAK